MEAVILQSFKDELDLLAGVDAWQINPDTPMVRGLASRVQRGTAYNTFTIRYRLPSGKPTEFDKRLTSIRNKDHGHLFPYLTIQAFVQPESGTLLSCAAIRTEALFQAAERLVTSRAIEYNRHPGLYGLQSLPEGTQFLYLGWNYLQHQDWLSSSDIFVQPPPAS